MATRHRSDISFDDLTLLATFAKSLDKVFINSNSPVYELEQYDMLLPFWVLTGNGWEVSHYRTITQEAIGLSRNGMIQVCVDYMHVPVKGVLEVLHKLAIVAVIPDTTVGDEPLFRQPFSGYTREDFEWPDYVSKIKHIKEGFIFEKRRTTGGFR